MNPKTKLKSYVITSAIWLVATAVYMAHPNELISYIVAVGSAVLWLFLVLYYTKKDINEEFELQKLLQYISKKKEDEDNGKGPDGDSNEEKL